MQGSKRDTDVKNRLLDSVEEGEGGMIWENNIETCILSYVKFFKKLQLLTKAGLDGGCMNGAWHMGWGHLAWYVKTLNSCAPSRGLTCRIAPCLPDQNKNSFFLQENSGATVW